MRLEDVLDGFEVLGGAEARAVAARFWTHASEADIATYLRLCTPLYNTTPRDPATAVGGIAQWDVFRHFSLPAGEIWQMDLRPGLAAVSAPTLVLTGDTDPVTPAARAQDIFAALKPGVGRYVEMAGTGHGTFRDAPEKSEALLRDFIAEAARP
jgi:proline iminopeptidase